MADMQARSYSEVKAVHPNQVVIGPAITRTSAGADASWTAEEYIPALYRNGVNGKLDGFTIHPYPGPAVDTDADIDGTDPFSEMFDTARTVKAANGDTTPLWITEVGVTTSDNTGAPNDWGVTEGEQRDILRKID